MAISEPQHRWTAGLIIVLLVLTLVLGVVLFAQLVRQIIISQSAQTPVPVIEPAATATPEPTATATLQPSPTVSPSPTATPSATSPPTVAPSATPTWTPEPCHEGLQNPGFETREGWKILDTAYQAGYVGSEYVTNPVRSGQQALRLGITEGTDVFSYSSAEQTIAIPAEATAARLSFWIYPVSAARRPGDLQYVLLLDEKGTYRRLVWELTNASGWQRREFSLNAYRGQQVTVRFGVKNDGDGARTAMYVDDVSLLLCFEASPTPQPG